MDWFWYLSFLLAQMVSQKTGFVGDIKSGVQSEACAKPFLIGREDLVYIWNGGIGKGATCISGHMKFTS